MKRYLSDKEIEKGYLDILENETVIKLEFKESGNSGWIQIELPQNAERNQEICGKPDYEDDDLLDEEKTESFIIYDNGVIAFDSWYPETVYNHLVKAIVNNIKDNAEKTESQKNSLKKYIDFLN